MNEEIFKPIIKGLISYYYEEGNNPTGGYLHVALDDGNLSDESLYLCQKECEENNDILGLLIATTLRCFSVEERELMYEIRWGMRHETFAK